MCVPGAGTLFYITKRAMVKKDYKELDEAIKSKITPYLYNGGKGKMVPIAQLTMLRNRDRPKSKQVRHERHNVCSLIKCRYGRLISRYFARYKAIYIW